MGGIHKPSGWGFEEGSIECDPKKHKKPSFRLRVFNKSEEPLQVLAGGTLAVGEPGYATVSKFDLLGEWWSLQHH